MEARDLDHAAVPPRAPGRFRIDSPAFALVVLTLINFVNYVDRQVVGVLAPLLGKPPGEGGLGLSDTQIGLLVPAFMVVHSIASTPLGVAADRYARTRLIAIGVAVWSVATAAAAFTSTFLLLLLARAAVGIGEAAYAPAASAIISEKFRRSVRARAFGIFQTGMMIGGVAVVVVGGYIGQHYGWRDAFLVVGVPGLLLAGLVLLVSEKSPDERERDPDDTIDAHGHPPPVGLREIRHMFENPAFRWVNIAGILITFFVGALIFWAPSFVLRYFHDNDKDQLAAVSATLGAVLVPAVLLGTMAGSFLADFLERRRPGAGRLLTIGLGSLASAPLALIGLWSNHETTLLVAIALGTFFNSFYVGPILAALHDVVPEAKRGTATGIYLLLIHLLGDAISPGIVGMVSNVASLRLGLSVAVVMLAVGGLAALRAIRYARPTAIPHVHTA